MSHAHLGHAPHLGHAHAPRARAAGPTVSLLRWSAGARVLAALLLVAPLWAWILALLG